MISSNILLHELSTGRKPRVATAMTMLKQMLFQYVLSVSGTMSLAHWLLYRYQGHIGAALVLGGIDETGSHLFTIHPHGSTDKLPYVTMGSGSLAAMAVFESSWKPNLSRQAAIDLVSEAIEAGIWNDLGSGSNVDVCIIEPKGTEMLRNYRTPNVKVAKNASYKFRRGTTAWTKEDVRSLIVSEEVIMQAGGLVAGPEGSGPGPATMEVDA